MLTTSRYTHACFVTLQWAEDLAQMKMLSADRLAYFEQPLHLVGYSMGGYIASVSDELPEKDMQQRQQLLKLIKYKQYRGITEKRLKCFFHDCHQQHSKFLNIVKQMDQDLGTAVLAAQISVVQPRKTCSRFS